MKILPELKEAIGLIHCSFSPLLKEVFSKDLMTSSHRMSGTQQYQLQEITAVFVNCSVVISH